jgi:prevent-host-death family protein
MPEARWSLQDAKNRLSSVVDAARRGQPQLVTRHGKPAAVVLAVEDFERLKALEGEAVRPSLADLLLALPQDDGSFERLPLEARPVEF